MKKWKSIKIEEDLMKELEPIIEDKSYKSKSEFLKLAIEEKLKTIRDEKIKDRLEELEEFFDKNAVTLRRKGINNMSDLTSQTLSNTEEIKKLKQRVKDFDDLSMMMGGKFKTLPIIVEKTKTGKIIRLATKEEIKRSKKAS